MNLAANAAMNLGEWDKLETYLDKIDDKQSQEFHFWNAAIKINLKQYDNAKLQITEAYKKIDRQVSGLLLESHSRAYDSLLRLQQLFEMEEIIEIKEFEESTEKLGKDSKGELKNEII